MMSRSSPCGREVFLVLIAKGQSMSQGRLCTYADWQGWRGTVRTLPCILMAYFIPQADFIDNPPSTYCEIGTLYHHTLGNMSCFNVNSFMPWVIMSHMPAFSVLDANWARFPMLYFFFLCVYVCCTSWWVRSSGLISYSSAFMLC